MHQGSIPTILHPVSQHSHWRHPQILQKWEKYWMSSCIYQLLCSLWNISVLLSSWFVRTPVIVITRNKIPPESAKPWKKRSCQRGIKSRNCVLYCFNHITLYLCILRRSKYHSYSCCVNPSSSIPYGLVKYCDLYVYHWLLSSFQRPHTHTDTHTLSLSTCFAGWQGEPMVDSRLFTLNH